MPRPANGGARTCTPTACLNDLREDDPETDRPSRSPTHHPRPAGPVLLDWLPPLEHVSCRFCLHVGNSPYGLAIRLTADTAYLRKPEMTDFLTRESLVVAGQQVRSQYPFGRIGTMTSRWESAIDKQIREATERGEFDNLPGAGKPIKGLDQPYDENWWVKEPAARENMAVVPPCRCARRSRACWTALPG